MRAPRKLLAAVTPLFFLVVTAQNVLAQAPDASPSAGASPVSEILDKGVCAPWHRCLAMGALGMALLAAVALGLGYLVQSKGFDKIEHRQGNPEGIKTD